MIYFHVAYACSATITIVKEGFAPGFAAIAKSLQRYKFLYPNSLLFIKLSSLPFYSIRSALLLRLTQAF